MREIKFRAWSKVDREMSDPFTIDELSRIAGKGIKPKHPEATYIKLQFTGLKDKNGREIYEGDIVKAQDTMNDADVLGDVVYYDHLGWFAVAINQEDRRHLNFYDLKNIEIIGNIYENPELLTQSR